MSVPAPHKARFHPWTLEEWAALPSPAVLVANAIEGGDLIAATGDKRFIEGFAKALGDGVICIEDIDGSLNSRWSLMRLADAIRSPCGDLIGPAVLIYLSGPSRNVDWCHGEADVVFEAGSADEARVIKVRNHDDQNKVLTLRGGGVVLEADKRRSLPRHLKSSGRPIGGPAAERNRHGQ